MSRPNSVAVLCTGMICYMPRIQVIEKLGLKSEGKRLCTFFNLFVCFFCQQINL